MTFMAQYLSSLPRLRNILASFGVGATSVHFLQTTDWYCRWRCEKNLEKSFVEPPATETVTLHDHQSFNLRSLLILLDFLQFFINRKEEAKVLHEKYFSSSMKSPIMLLFCNPTGYGKSTLVLEAAALRPAKGFGTLLTQLKPDVAESKLAIESTIDSILPTPLFNYIYPISKQSVFCVALS